MVPHRVYQVSPAGRRVAVAACCSECSPHLRKALVDMPWLPAGLVRAVDSSARVAAASDAADAAIERTPKQARGRRHSAAQLRRALVRAHDEAVHRSRAAFDAEGRVRREMAEAWSRASQQAQQQMQAGMRPDDLLAIIAGDPALQVVVFHHHEACLDLVLAQEASSLAEEAIVLHDAQQVDARRAKAARRGSGGATPTTPASPPASAP